MKRLLLLALILGSCATQRNANKYYDKHPQELAELCGDKFPPRDSIATDTVYREAENQNYTHQIDSLRTQALMLMYDLADFQQQMTMRQTPADVQECQQTINNYQKQIGKLLGQVDELKKKATSLSSDYKPCLPDTLRIDNVIYRANTAKETALLKAWQIAAFIFGGLLVISLIISLIKPKS
jgi:peptidoglycan hydrolase CwlO-like protein